MAAAIPFLFLTLASVIVFFRAFDRYYEKGVEKDRLEVYPYTMGWSAACAFISTVIAAGILGSFSSCVG